MAMQVTKAYTSVSVLSCVFLKFSFVAAGGNRSTRKKQVRPNQVIAKWTAKPVCYVTFKVLNVIRQRKYAPNKLRIDCICLF